MKNWRMVTFLLLSLVLSGSTACSSAVAGGPDQQLAQATKGDLTVSVSGTGNIETSREARSSFGAGGRVDKIHVKEGDKVSQGEVLAELDADALELAKTRAKVDLTQAEVAMARAQLALTQAQLAQQTAEFEFESVLDTRDTLELALLNAQIDLETARYNMQKTTDLYTWSDIKIAQADVDEAEDYLEYALEQLYKYIPETEKGDYPNIDGDFPKTEGYKVWQERVVHAQARLNTAKGTLDAMTSGRDLEQVAIKKMLVESAEKAEAQAQKSLDRLAEEIALKELQVETTKDSVLQARESLELAQQSVVLARQSLSHAQKNLDEATITAAFDGVVASLGAEEGDIVSATSTIVYLVDPISVELIVEVDEIDMPGVRLNQEAVISIDAMPDVPFKGRVTAIYPVSTKVSGIVMYNVKIELDVPENSDLKIGMSASADIITNKRSNVLLVPSKTIKQNGQGEPVVQVLVNKQIQERSVVTGISNDSETEIVSGLSDGEMLIQ